MTLTGHQELCFPEQSHLQCWRDCVYSTYVHRHADRSHLLLMPLQQEYMHPVAGLPADGAADAEPAYTPFARRGRGLGRGGGPRRGRGVSAKRGASAVAAAGDDTSKRRCDRVAKFTQAQVSQQKW